MLTSFIGAMFCGSGSGIILDNTCPQAWFPGGSATQAMAMYGFILYFIHCSALLRLAKINHFINFTLHYITDNSQDITHVAYLNCPEHSPPITVRTLPISYVRIDLKIALP